MLSQLTVNIMNFVFLIQLFKATESSIATAFLWVSYSLPAIFVGPIAAAYVDMVDRRKLLMITNFFQALTILIYSFIYGTSLFLVYWVAITYSLLNQFYLPAEQASLPSVIHKVRLPSANGLFFLTQQFALVMGFGLAGIINSTLGFQRTLYLCSGLLFLAFVSVSLLPPFKRRVQMPKNFEKAFLKFFERIFEGYRFIKNERSILLPFFLLVIFWVGLSVVTINAPAFAVEIVQVDIDISGIVLVVPAAVGAMLGSLFVPKALRHGTRKKVVIEASLIVITLVLLVVSFVVPGIPLFNLRVLLSSFAVLLIGASFMGVFIPSQTFLQEKTPGGMRGRLFGNFWFVVTVATIFPTIISGTLTELFGARTLFAVLALCSFVIWFISRGYGHQILRAKIIEQK